MHATTKMTNLAKLRQRFGENSRMSEGAPWKVTSDEKGKLGKRINLAKTERWCLKGSLERWWFWRKMANLTKMTNSPFWSHRRVYYFRQNRHYWRGAFEHLIRSSVTSLANFAKFATFQGASLLSYLARSWGVDEFLPYSPFSPNSAHSSKSSLSISPFDLSFEFIV